MSRIRLQTKLLQNFKHFILPILHFINLNKIIQEYFQAIFFLLSFYVYAEYRGKPSVIKKDLENVEKSQFLLDTFISLRIFCQDFVFNEYEKSHIFVGLYRYHLMNGEGRGRGRGERKINLRIRIGTSRV